MRQAAQKKAVIERKRKKAEEARWKHEKEMEIAQRVRARENRRDVESKLESEDSIEVGDDMIFSEEEESREVVATLVEHRYPVAASAGGVDLADVEVQCPDGPRSRVTGGAAE